MKKKIALLLAMCIVAGGVLTGCGGSSDANGTVSVYTQASEEDATDIMSALIIALNS